MLEIIASMYNGSGKIDRAPSLYGLAVTCSEIKAAAESVRSSVKRKVSAYEGKREGDGII
jgi:hypothetical protein